MSSGFFVALSAVCVVVTVSVIMRNMRGNRAVARASGLVEQIALQQPPPHGKSTIYAFRDDFYGMALGSELVVDGRSIGQLRGKTFYRMDLPAGEHTVVSRVAGQSTEVSVKVALAAGERVYLRERMKAGFAAASTRLERVGEAEGAIALNKCRLLEGDNPGNG